MQKAFASAILLGGLALGTTASADIVYSGSMAVKVINGDLGVGSPETVTIGGYTWEFGFVDGGPLDYAFLNVQDDHGGLFTTGFGQFDVNNFDANDNIGFATPSLEMYPIGGGSSNDNLVIHDYVADTGDFGANDSGYVGFAFGTVGDRRYGWMEFSLTSTVDRNVMTLLGWAYNNEAGGSILAGQTGIPVVPGAGAAASLIGIAGFRGRRRRG